MGSTLNPTHSSIRPHVLLVSDDPDLSGFLAEGLIVAGLWTSVVASPFQALEVFRLRSFDAVIVDAAVGGFGALELLRRLRARPDGSQPSAARADVPVVLVAGSVQDVDPAASATAGADAVIAAPLEIEEVAAAVLSLVVRWRQEHPERPWADGALLDRR